MWTKSVKMSKVQMLRSLVEQRLTAAAEEIFGLFERTIAEYEEELCRTKEENQRRQQILDDVRNQKVLIHRTECPADDHQVLVVKEEVPPEQQDWSPSLDQDQEDPQPPYIKEEQQELWTSQEADITTFPSTPVAVKSEDDEEEAQSSQLHQRQTEENREEPDGEDCGGPEPDMNPVHIKDLKSRAAQSRQSKSRSRRTFDNKSSLETHMDTRTGERLVGSSECGGTFSQKTNMTQVNNTPRDMMTNNDLTVSDVGCKRKRHQCSECGKTFNCRSKLNLHMKIHTGEKPFSCSVCQKHFRDKSTVRKHMVTHTAEKAFSCLVCQKRFKLKHHLQAHMRTHTREETWVGDAHNKFTQPEIQTEMNLDEQILMNRLKTVLMGMNVSPSKL